MAVITVPAIKKEEVKKIKTSKDSKKEKDNADQHN